MAKQEPGSPQTKGGSAIATTATASAADQNVSRYFKQLLRARPELLEERSNDAIYSIWLADNPGHKEVPKKVQQGLSNVKSILRKEMGTKSPRRRKGKRGRKAKAKAAILSNGDGTRHGPCSQGIHQGARSSGAADRRLPGAGRKIGDAALETAINYLRKARIQIGVRLGLTH